jgi:hypothetical protein
VGVTYDAPSLTGTAVTGGKVSLVSASNGTIVIAVSAESSEDLYFTIKQTAVVGGNGATIEGVRQVTLKKVVRPTSVAIEGKGTITEGNHTYTAVLSPSTANVPMTYVWAASGSSNVTIQSTDGATCVVAANRPNEDETFTLSCTATSADGKTTVSDTLSGTLQNKPSFIVATYNVTSTTSATQLLSTISSFPISYVTSMEVDGVSVTPSKTYKFATTGVHTVKFGTKNLQNAFYNCSQLLTIDFSLLDGASITSLEDTFRDCTSLTSIECSGCTFPNVTTLDTTFQNCKVLTSIEWGGCTFPNVTYLSYTFRNCTSLTSIDLTPFDGAPITSLSGTFYRCKSLKAIIAPWTTAPTVSSSTFGNSTSNYTGRNTYSTGVNKLYVPAGATGYDSSYWLDPLQNSSKCGFTLSATL